jgi:NAD(P)-dependent dehydrogenase (short-subunit alcohol dehydrogenase family)
MSDKRLQDKVCIVTGSTSGIGRAIAELFAEKGGKVVVSGIDEEAGRQVAEGIDNSGGVGCFIRCDVSIKEDCEGLISTTVDRFGGLDVLANNAAATSMSLRPGNKAAEVSPENFETQIRVNLWGTYYLCHLAIPHMRSRGGGSIVNTSSVGGLVALPNSAAYTASKAAIIQLAKSIALDYAADNIRANALCPGWIRSEIETARIEKDPEGSQKALDRMGVRRFGEPREMAYAALFLACDESSYVTGTALVADGGWTLQ